MDVLKSYSRAEDSFLSLYPPITYTSFTAASSAHLYQSSSFRHALYVLHVTGGLKTPLSFGKNTSLGHPDSALISLKLGVDNPTLLALSFHLKWREGDQKIHSLTSESFHSDIKKIMKIISFTVNGITQIGHISSFPIPNH